VQWGNDQRRLCIISVAYIGGVSGNLKKKKIRGRNNIRTVFKTKTTSGSYLRKIIGIKDILEKSHFVYKTLCGCGRDYRPIEEMGRPLDVRLKDHNHNLNEGRIQMSILALGTFRSQYWHYMPFKKGTSLTGHKLVFYSLSPMLLIGNMNKRLAYFFQQPFDRGRTQI
jgi:hypothetical protein